jgi:RNA polymerase sigma factor (TIGR02999 family)
MSALPGWCVVPDPKTGEVTALLRAWRAGNDEALGQASALLYQELRRQARLHMRRESPGHILQTTALVHEAFLRLVESDAVHLNDRTHFLAAAAGVMRHVLIDLARRHSRHKRGGRALHVPLDPEAALATDPRSVDLTALDEALDALAAFDSRKARVVELRFFAGLTVEETADVLDVSVETVQRDWRLARCWLLKTLTDVPTDER